jgi:hypothetical protein
MGIVLVLIIGYFMDPFALDNVLSILSYAVTVFLAIAVFAMPIMGIRDRIEEEKERVLNRTSDLLQIAGDSLHGKVMNNDYSGMTEAEAAISALMHERDLYGRISTLPWDPGALRTLGSALLLPIALWLITRLLERFLSGPVLPAERLAGAVARHRRKRPRMPLLSRSAVRLAPGNTSGHATTSSVLLTPS